MRFHSLRKMAGRCCHLAFLLCCAVLPAFAQVTGGTIQGSVTDRTGASVVKAEITVTNLDTAIARQALVNSAGYYVTPNLQPGRYEVKVVSTGFATEVVGGLTLNVGADLTVNATLRPGVAMEQVQVTALQGDVDLQSSALASNVDARTIRELPLNARDWTQLAQLEPGVDLVRSQPSLAINNTRENRGLGNSLTIGGARPQQNNYRLDGISINDFANGAPGSVSGSVLGVDAIQEFSVITGNAPADYSKESGGIINAVTRSGTNEFRGSAYEFLRNSVFDARNSFDGPTIPSFKRNQFGGSVGFPIRKDRTFVFANYEGLRQGVGLTLLNTVPSPNARAGHLASGTTITVDPQVVPFLNLYPLPNGTITGDTGVSTIVAKQITNENFFTTKGDQVFGQHDSLAATYMYNSGLSSGPDSLADTLLGAQSQRQLGTLSETHTFSPSLLNTLRVGYSRIVAQAPIALSALNSSAADTTLGAYPGTTAPALTVSGIAAFQGGLGANANWRYHYNSYQLYDDAFLTRGAHTIKFGVSIERLQANEAGGGSPFGIFTFASLQNFLINKPSSFKGPLAAPTSINSLRQTIVGGYVEDDWRILPNLTLNLGLRYEMSTVPSEEHGRVSTLVNFGSITNQVGNPLFQNPTLKNFEPRFGFAWDPFRRGATSFRGSAGVYDVLPLPYLFELTTLQSAPFFQQGSTTTPTVGSFPRGAVSQLSASSLRYQFIQNQPPRNYVLQWSLGVQQELARSVTLASGYAGSHGVHQPFHGEDINTVQPSLTSSGYMWPASNGTVLFPNAGQVSGVFWNGMSVYHALNAKLTTRITNGLQMQAAYTWSKSIDVSSASIAGDAFTNSIFNIELFDHRITRAPSDYDVRHTFSATYTWKIPTIAEHRPWLSAIVDGWQSNSLFQAASGQPFSVGVSGDPLGLKSVVTYDFPDRLRGSGCDTAVNPHSKTFIKTQCFALPTPVQRLGNSPRNSLIGPALLTFDTSIFRNIPIKTISERFNVQFRTECFNCINHTNLAAPVRANRDIFSQTGALLSTAGVVTSTATTSRQLQFGLKLAW